MFCISWAGWNTQKRRACIKSHPGSAPGRGGRHGRAALRRQRSGDRSGRVLLWLEELESREVPNLFGRFDTGFVDVAVVGALGEEVLSAAAETPLDFQSTATQSNHASTSLGDDGPSWRASTES